MKVGKRANLPTGVERGRPRGRPPIPEADRLVRWSFRLHPLELQKANRAAEAQGLTASEFVRRAVVRASGG